MAHAQKPVSVFRRNGRVHLNRRGRQFSRLMAAEVCASAGSNSSDAGYTMFWGSVKSTGYPFHSAAVSPSLPFPCVTVCPHISIGVYVSSGRNVFLWDFEGSGIRSKLGSDCRFFFFNFCTAAQSYQIKTWKFESQSSKQTLLAHVCISYCNTSRSVMFMFNYFCRCCHDGRQ